MPAQIEEELVLSVEQTAQIEEELVLLVEQMEQKA